VIAVKLPLMLLGELRHILGGAGQQASGAGGGVQGQATMPGAERMRAAHARLRNVGLQGIPSLGRSAGRAAGALGAPAGGPLGAARRGLAGAATRTGLLARVAPATAAARTRARLAAERGSGPPAFSRPGVRERLTRARRIFGDAPREARAAMAGVPPGVREAIRDNRGTASVRADTRGTTPTARRWTVGKQKPVARTVEGSGNAPGKPAAGSSRGPQTLPRPHSPSQPKTPSQIPGSPTVEPSRAGSAGGSNAHPGQRVTSSPERDASARLPQSPPGKSSAANGQDTPPPRPPHRHTPPPKRGPRHGSES
jgi:hypothetical protein